MNHKNTVLVHGKMIYSCESCKKSWPMYLEKGIEEFGDDHKPSPFIIRCPYCGGMARDVSGIIKNPQGYSRLPDGLHYFSNQKKILMAGFRCLVVTKGRFA